MKELKFRPSLTLEEIQYIVECVALTNPSKVRDSVRRKLEVFTLKAKHGITSPSHLTIGKQSLESKLGLADDDRIDTLLQHYYSNPSILSRAQLKRVQFHRFQNDLMTPEEEEQYLAGEQ